MTDVPKTIWVDRDLKRCSENSHDARKATYIEEYDLYVIDKPKG